MEQKQSTKPSTDLSYFGIQSEWGITKHFGGLRATDRIAGLTRLGPGQTVLQIGCGDGIASAHLVKTFACRLTGIDLNPKMVAWAEKRARRKGVEGQAQFQQADAQQLPFEPDSFDVVVCESVTAFVPEKPQAVCEYARVVKPGGYVALNEGTWLAPPPPSLVEFVKRTMGGVDFQMSGSWEDLLAGAGLILLYSQVERIDAMQQRRDETAGLDRQDWIDRLRALGTLLKLYAGDPAFRRYAKTLVPSRKDMRDMFKYLGYGLFVGQKPV